MLNELRVLAYFHLTSIAEEAKTRRQGRQKNPLWGSSVEKMKRFVLHTCQESRFKALESHVLAAA